MKEEGRERLAMSSQDFSRPREGLRLGSRGLHGAISIGRHVEGGLAPVKHVCQQSGREEVTLCAEAVKEGHFRGECELYSCLSSQKIRRLA